MSWKKYLIIPQLAWHGVRAPKGGVAAAWERYWSGVKRTGDGGEVLWDAARTEEIEGALARMREHMDARLPIVDLGCGNGRHARVLASHFTTVLGIDLSTHALERAREESSGIDNITYRALDAAAPGAGQTLHEEIGDANIYVRGILHILDHRQRLAFVENIRDALGARGVLYVVETAFPGSPLDYMEFLGGTSMTLPLPVEKLIEAGLAAPEHFREPEYRRYFPEARWETLACGATLIDGIEMRPGGDPLRIPSFFAIARPRA